MNSHRPVRVLMALALSLPIFAALPGPAAAAVPMTLLEDGFTQPVYMTHAGDARLFVVEKGGKIKIVGGGTFLDITGNISSAGERGLLGLAFDPNYASNGLFYIDYTRPDGDVIIAERRRSTADPDVADPSYERLVLRIEHSSQTNHNGGWIGFDSTGNLMIAVGDGGNGQSANGQRLNTHLGKILRINPHNPPGAAAFSVPSNNPFVGRSGWDAIWAYGFRNPWRCSFDRGTGVIWCGDVGQEAWEEINRGPMKGNNYGWRLLEGFHYYDYPNRPSGQVCTSRCKTLPILEYGHQAGPNSVVGGYVSRRPGAAMNGKYVFGDLGGRIWIIPATFQRGDTLPAPEATTAMRIFSFAEGADGKLYVIDGAAGEIHTLTES